MEKCLHGSNFFFCASAKLRLFIQCRTLHLTILQQVVPNTMALITAGLTGKDLLLRKLICTERKQPVSEDNFFKHTFDYYWLGNQMTQSATSGIEHNRFSNHRTRYLCIFISS